MVAQQRPSPVAEEHRRLELEERYRRAGGDTIEHQRARTSWAGQRADGANPTLDGLIAGTKAGLLGTAIGLAVVGAATVGSRSFRAASLDLSPKDDGTKENEVGSFCSIKKSVITL